MRIALIGDIHGNLPALEAVLDHAREQNAEAIWNIGDFVGYGPFPDEVIRLLRDAGAVSIYGNYDRKVLKFPQKELEWGARKMPEKWLAFKWAYDHLSDESKAYLQSLPIKLALTVSGWQILLVHGSPASQDEHLNPDTPLERMLALAHMTNARIIIFGHSHVPFVRQINETWFINTGSVGRPDDGDPRASYALLDLDAGVRNVTHFRVAYNVSRAVDAIRQYHLPENFAQMLIQGRSLEFIQKG